MHAIFFRNLILIQIKFKIINYKVSVKIMKGSLKCLSIAKNRKMSKTSKKKNNATWLVI